MNIDEEDIPRRYASVAAVARRLGTTTYRVYDAVNRLELPAKKDGARIRIKIADADEWFDNLPNVGDDD